MNSTDRYSFGWLFTSQPRRSGFPQPQLNGDWSTTNPPAEGMKTGLLWPYLKSIGVYHCPIDMTDYQRGTNTMTSYLMNGAECGYGARGTNGPPYPIPGSKITQFVRPSESTLFWETMEQRYEGESLTGAVWNDGSSYPTEEVMSDRHYKGANVSMLDGHIEWWDRNTYNLEAGLPPYPTSPYPTRLWCSPYSSNGH